MLVTVLLEGFHAVKHALRFGADVQSLITTDLAATISLAETHAPDLRERFAAATEVDEEQFKRRFLIGRIHPTGVAGLADRPNLPFDRGTPLVLLDNPRNLGNFGAAIRVAAGLDAGGVISTGDVDPWHPNVLRGSAGLHFALPVARATSLDFAGELIAFDAGGELLKGPIPDDAVLAFGSERHGLSAEVRAKASRIVSLPMRETISSYNLTTSVAMGLYHWAIHRAS
ncbi:TrmH family RNA methyltransferase [Lentzea sp. BCCO 10_0798]|uniref:TrmH family RNA methyltransferase n=1 Tax=Lentzea kristufekii TaxID=3095430 RepID=A0ABU4TMR0_9PSEU|nr:TrmH family RNA methyltransferase [Lentzea sp. BCCO 10_0798]MDX8049212.1 TrmH family RNA methyltransferase [Lentzea sp. BCCO 10_0798]